MFILTFLFVLAVTSYSEIEYSDMNTKMTFKMAEVTTATKYCDAGFGHHNIPSTKHHTGHLVCIY